MTNTIVPADTASIVAEFSGGSAPSVDMMIGIGLVKDSEAVFFQYEGDDKKSALMLPNGKPVPAIRNVYLTGVSVAEDIGEFNSVKLNIFLETQQGRTIMLTSGLTTMWSQCVMTGLMGLADTGSINSLISIESWKGTSKMRPCFASVKNGNVKVTSNGVYQSLAEARADRDNAKKESLMRDCVLVLSAMLTGEEVVPAEVSTDVPSAEELF